MSLHHSSCIVEGLWRGDDKRLCRSPAASLVLYNASAPISNRSADMRVLSSVVARGLTELVTL
jgi:hypothetical protein